MDVRSFRVFAEQHKGTRAGPTGGATAYAGVVANLTGNPRVCA